MKPIEEGWEILRNIREPGRKLSPAVRAAMRDTFYCGAEWLWHKLREAKSNSSVYQAIEEELRQFNKEFET